jgi:hypothetical protein
MPTSDQGVKSTDGRRYAEHEHAVGAPRGRVANKALQDALARVKSQATAPTVSPHNSHSSYSRTSGG